MGLARSLGGAGLWSEGPTLSSLSRPAASSGHSRQSRLWTARTDSQDSAWSLEAEGHPWEAAMTGPGLDGKRGCGQGSCLTSGLFITWAPLPSHVAEWILAVCHSGAFPASLKGLSGEGSSGFLLSFSPSPLSQPSADHLPLRCLGKLQSPHWGGGAGGGAVSSSHRHGCLHLDTFPGSHRHGTSSELKYPFLDLWILRFPLRQALWEHWGLSQYCPDKYLTADSLNENPNL